MALLDAARVENEAALLVASLMAASARTAPKTQGDDATSCTIVEGEDLEKLAACMEHIWDKKPVLAPYAVRDAGNVRNSACVVLLGVSGRTKRMPVDCGACGFPSCNALGNAKRRNADFIGPCCMFQVLDLGIALGSAVKTAGQLNIDNRIMTTVGIAAKRLGLLDADIILGIPLSVSAKSPYFDRR